MFCLRGAALPCCPHLQRPNQVIIDVSDSQLAHHRTNGSLLRSWRQLLPSVGRHDAFWEDVVIERAAPERRAVPHQVSRAPRRR
jgi:hypothetical protein